MGPAEIAALSALATEARARADAATPGPWYTSGYCDDDVVRDADASLVARCECSDDAASIVAARDDVPALADGVAALVAALAEATAATARAEAAIAAERAARLTEEAERMAAVTAGARLVSQLAEAREALAEMTARAERAEAVVAAARDAIDGACTSSDYAAVRRALGVKP